jgi:hypothetical protein
MVRQVVPFQGRDYVWDGREWYGSEDYTIPPRSIAVRLDDLLAERLAGEEETLTDWNELLRRAKMARDRLQYKRAERLARRAHDLRPDDVRIASVLCSVLREACKPRESLELADRFRDSGYAPLLTSRAAALCDLGRWAEALTQIRAVLAAGKSEPAQAVYQRIRTVAPEVFPKPAPQAPRKKGTRPQRTRRK